MVGRDAGLVLTVLDDGHMFGSSGRLGGSDVDGDGFWKTYDESFTFKYDEFK